MRSCLSALLVALLLCLLATQVVAVGLPAGTTIRLAAEATYEDAGGNVFSADPVWATLTVAQGAGVVVERTGPLDQATPGQDFYIPLNVVNTGNGADAFTLSAFSTKGWSAAVVYDDNGDGVHQSEELSDITTTGLMVADGYSPCFVRVTVPRGAMTGDIVTISAVSNHDATGSSQAPFTVDVMSPPSVAIETPTSDPTYPVTQPSVDISGTASGGLAITEVEWVTDHGDSGTCSGTSSWAATGIVLQLGPNVITVTATDSDGRTGTDTCTITYNKPAPPIIIEPPDTSAPTPSISSPTSAAIYTAATASIDLAGAASDDVGVTSVTWSNDRGGLGTCAGTTSWNASAIALSTGQNIITVAASDAAGNVGSAVLTVTYEPSAPIVRISSPTSAATYAVTIASIDMAGSASDDIGVTSVDWSNDRGGSGMCTGTTSWSASGIALSTGQNIITVTASDADGHKDAAVLTVTYGLPDTSAPTLSIHSPTTATTYAATSASIDMAGVAFDNVGVTSVTWRSDRGGSGICAGTTRWSVSDIALSTGRNIITVTASDAAGNKASRSLTAIYGTDPIIEIDTPTDQGQCARNCPVVTIGGTALDNSAITGIAWSNAADGQTGACVLDGAAWSAAGIGLVAGDNVITATATDDSGNTATAVVTVTWVDVVPGAAWTGLAMVSLPIVPDEADPKLEVGFQGDYWCVFVTDANSYAVYPDSSTWLDPADSTPGRGFWTCFDSQTTPPYGTIPPQDQPATIHLNAGWNLIGTPFIREVTWDVSKLMVKGPDGSVRALRDAPDLTPGFAWGWRQDPNDPRTGAYYLVWDSSIMPGVDNKMEPWRAYWIKALSNCDLVIPPP